MNSSLPPAGTVSRGVFSRPFEMSLCPLMCLRGCVIVPLCRAGHRVRHVFTKDRVAYEGVEVSFNLSLTTANI